MMIDAFCLFFAKIEKIIVSYNHFSQNIIISLQDKHS